MISNQTAINAAIAATVIRNAKISSISHRKTNNYRHKSIVENRYNQIKQNTLSKHGKVYNN